MSDKPNEVSVEEQIAALKYQRGLAIHPLMCDAILSTLRRYAQMESALRVIPLIMHEAERNVRLGPSGKPIAAYDQDLIDAIATVRAALKGPSP